MITEPAPRPSAAVSATAEPPMPEAHVSELAFFRNATIVWSISFSYCRRRLTASV